MPTKGKLSALLENGIEKVVYYKARMLLTHGEASVCVCGHSPSGT